MRQRHGKRDRVKKLAVCDYTRRKQWVLKLVYTTAKIALNQGFFNAKYFFVL